MTQSETQPEQQPAPGPKQFQVIYRRDDYLIVGLSPKGGGVGPNNRLAVIHDMSEQENLRKYDPAYYDPDGDHIIGVPPNAA